MQDSSPSMPGMLEKIKGIFIDILPGVKRQKKERTPAKNAVQEEEFIEPEIKKALDEAERETFNMLRSFVKGIYTLPPNSHSLYSPMHVWTGICVGDIAGSIYEGSYIAGTEEETEKRKARSVIEENFFFTDDSVMSAAVMKATEEIIKEPLYMDILQESLKNDREWKKWVRKVEEMIDPPSIYARKMKEYAKRYPSAGYGAGFFNWAVLDMEGFEGGSFGDGSAMRSGTIGAFFNDLRKVITFAYFSAVPTHAHPEGIKGAVVTAVAVWMAAHGYSRQDIVRYAGCQYDKNTYKPHASMTIAEMKKKCVPAVKLMSLKCQVAVPEAFVSLNSSDDFESALMWSLSYPCDTDTVMAITGGIAAALYGTIEYQGVSGAEYLEKKGALQIISE